MPTLTYTTAEGLHGGILNSRVLIGRRLSHGISLTDGSVSRLHAWIDPVADEHADWVVTDAGSKSGTYVNEQKIDRHPLHDGDVIRVGKVSLTYHEQDQLPADATLVELIAPPLVDRSSGILFECSCGAPLWVGYELAGKRGMCRHCRKPVTVPPLEEPQQSPVAAAFDASPPPPPLPPVIAISPQGEHLEEQVDENQAPVEAPIEEIEEYAEPLQDELRDATTHDDFEPVARPLHASAESDETNPEYTSEYESDEHASAGRMPEEPGEETIPVALLDTPVQRVSSRQKNKCAVCHSAIVAEEEMTTCPDCAMVFHAECWEENLGCSSYGCPQVNRLAPTQDVTDAADLESEQATVDEKRSFPWELVLLAASVIGVGLGGLSFGIAAAVVALVAVVMLIVKRPKNTFLLISAILISMIGIFGGLVVSDLLYCGGTHLPLFVVRLLSRFNI